MRAHPKTLAAISKRHVTRLLARRRFAHSVRPSDVFIVTYPKSGTEWVRFLIANSIKGNPNEEISFVNHTNYVPDINEIYFAQNSLGEFAFLPDPRFFSVHAPYDPIFPKVIYVLRDPRDVMVSYYHYKRLTDANFCSSLQDFVTSDNHYPCRWDEHVAGWLLNGPNASLCLVRYEEMHQDTHSVLKRVLNFAGLHYSEADILQAVEASRFERMRAAEEKHGIPYPDVLTNSGERFVRQGKIGGYRTELDVESIRILDEKYGSIMRVVGYEPGC
jgi:sulfotransferase family protein